MRYLLIIAAILAASGAAFAQFNGCPPGFCPGLSGGSGIPPVTGNILLVDGTSFILQTDGASKVCRAGGC